jgi:hypothetical protein
MSNKPISVALSIFSAGAVAWAAASCSESTNNGPNDSGSEAASSSSSSSGGFGTSSSGASSSSGSGSSSGSSSGVDAGGTVEGGGACVGTAANQPLLDDMSVSTGTAIAFKPPACAQKGTWFDYAGAGGGTISPYMPFVFSPSPAGFPADAGVPEAGPSSDAGGSDGGDGGDSGALVQKAACVSGATGTMAYSSTGMGFNLATTPNPDGGYSNPVAIDAHSYTGIEFWAWGGPIDGGGSMQSVTVQAYDKNETTGFGVCDPDLNEMMLDPSTLTKIQWQVQLMSPHGGTPIPFNFCVYYVSFY